MEGEQRQWSIYLQKPALKPFPLLENRSQSGWSWRTMLFCGRGRCAYS